MRKFLTGALFLLQAVVAFGQTSTGITGKVVDSKTQKPLANVVATIQNINLTQVTNNLGVFRFDGVAPGAQIVQVKSQGYKAQMLQVDIVENQTIDLGTIVLEEDITQEQQLSLITITENDLGDDNSGSESTSGLLQASRDAFQQTAAFNWGQARFRIRGLDNEYATTMLNGITMNKIYDGRPQWSNWGGLNDATRNQEFTTGSAPSDYTFGGILGTQEINTRASSYRKGTRVSFSSTNTNYSFRTMATHVSGMNKNGWAFVVSGSRRWADEGYFEGTDYSANSLFASIEKRFNAKHSLNFTSIYAQNSRGKSSPNTDEVTNIAGIKYNSYWGYQDGKKRNSRDKDILEPINMLTHYWKMSDKTTLTTTAAYQTGSVGNTRLDYSGVNSPDPSYYRNMPSYFTSFYNTTPGQVPASAFEPGGLGGVFTPNYLAASNPAAAIFLDPNNRQINWNNLYQANTQTVSDANGNDIGRRPSESKYVLYEDRSDDKVLSANSVISSQLADNISMNGGILYRNLKSHNFQNLLDLLGGSYFLDIDTFGVGDQKQSDLNNPNRKVGVGEKYGYNYNLMATTINAFTQFKFTYRKLDFYLGQEYSRTEYQREGLYKNGYYPKNSLGLSKKLTYDNFGFKGGLTFKATGNHIFNVNGVYMTKAPNLRSAFPNSRANNNSVAGLDNETVSSADASYIIRSPKLKARFTGYYSRINNATETSFFFAEGIFNGSEFANTDAFVAETVTNIDKQNIGGEFGLEYQVTSTIKLIGSAAYGQYTYANNPTVRLNQDGLATPDNPNPVFNFGEATLKNYHVPNTPQQAYSIGAEYRDPKFWWVGANLNYLASNYIDIAPVLRTATFIKNPEDLTGQPFPEATESRARQLLKQQRFDDFTLLNLTGGKSWRTKSRQTIGFFASVNNVLDTTYKTGGFEQVRKASYRELNQDVSSGTQAFAPKYFYGYGRTYFVNVYINF